MTPISPRAFVRVVVLVTALAALTAASGEFDLHSTSIFLTLVGCSGWLGRSLAQANLLGTPGSKRVSGEIPESVQEPKPCRLQQ